jgi:hypothetical protein
LVVATPSYDKLEIKVGENLPGSCIVKKNLILVTIPQSKHNI